VVLARMQDVCNETFVVDAAYGLFGYKLVRAPKRRTPRPAELPQYVDNTAGQKFEIGSQPAASTLRAPKASSARTAAAAHSAAAAPPPACPAAWALAGVVAAAFLYA
jgi:hypothetical protein